MEFPRIIINFFPLVEIATTLFQNILQKTINIGVGMSNNKNALRLKKLIENNTELKHFNHCLYTRTSFEKLATQRLRAFFGVKLIRTELY